MNESSEQPSHSADGAPGLNSDQDSKLVVALKECQEMIDQGKPIDRNAILNKFPQIRQALSACLDGMDLLDQCGEASKWTLRLDSGETHMQRILGDFKILNELGRGGMGVVYEAEQLSVGRNVALKVLHYAALLDKRQVVRFKNEARAAASLEHPNIVPVFYVGSERGVYYYAMKLIDGRNLAEVLNDLQHLSPLMELHQGSHERGRCDTTTKSMEDSSDPGNSPFQSKGWRSRRNHSYYRSVAEVGRQIANALHFAHMHGIVHRDVKPGNILIDSEGKAWITDFGLARVNEESNVTRTGEMLGTLRYMSPEQASGHAVNVSYLSDVYSLGASLYEMLTFSPVYRGQDRNAIMRQVKLTMPCPPRKLDARIPRELENIVLKALQKQPAERYQTAEQLAEDLERFLCHKPVRARPTPLRRKGLMWARRHSTFVTASSVLCSVLLILLAVSSSMFAKYERERRLQQQIDQRRLEIAFEDRQNALDHANSNLRLAIRHRDRANQNAERAERLSQLAGTRMQRLRERLYAHEMHLAFEAFGRGWSGTAIGLLDGQLPQDNETDLRKFDWYSLNARLWRPDVIELAGHSGPVRDIALLPDRQLVSVGDDHTIRGWEIESGQQVFELIDDREPINLDGELMHRDRDFLNAETLLVSTPMSNLRSLAVSPDGRFLATGNLVLSLWDLTHRQRLHDLAVFPTRIFGVAFSPDGKRVAAHAADHELRVVDLSGKLVTSKSTDAGAYRLSFSSNGLKLAAPYWDASKGKTSVRSWHTSDWGIDQSYPLPHHLRGCEFVPNEDILICGSSKCSAFALDLSSQKRLFTVPKQRSITNDIAISPDSRRLAIAYSDGTVAIVSLPRGWKDFQATRELVPTILSMHDGNANAVRFVDNDRIVTAGDDGFIRICTIRQSEKCTRHPLTGSRLLCQYQDFHGRFVVASNGVLHLFSQGFDRVVRRIRVWHQHGEQQSAIQTTAIAVAPKKNQVALGTNQNEIFICDLETDLPSMRIAPAHASKSAIADLAYSPDGKTLAVGSVDHSIRIRATDSWKEILRVDTDGWGRNVEFSNDGHYLAYSNGEGMVVVLETTTWKEVSRRETNATLTKGGLRFSNDDRCVITGHRDSVIRVWRTDDLSPIGKLEGHESVIRKIEVHPDHDILLSFSSDRTLRLWNLATLMPVGTMHQFKNSNGDFCLSQTGNQLMIIDSDGEQSECELWEIGE